MRSRILALALASLACGMGGAAEEPKIDSAQTALAVDPEKYQIGPEDLLFVRVWREPDFTLPLACLLYTSRCV